MGYIAKYGSYPHDVGEVLLSFDRQVLRAQTQVPYALRITGRIEGYLQADSQTELLSKMASLRSAYSVDRQDFSWATTGGTDTVESITNRQTMENVQVIQQPSFFRADPREWNLFVSYRIVIRADVAAAGNVIMEWQESVETTGDGGPIEVFVPTLSGSWQKQRTTERSPVTARQHGRAVGLRDYPTPQPPYWPADLVRNRQTVKFLTPRRLRKSLWEFPVMWSYEYKSNSVLLARPRVSPFRI